MGSKIHVAVSAQTLAALEAFAPLTIAEREQIASRFHGRRYTPGEFIIRQTDLDHGVFFVVSGIVRVTFFSQRGREVSFRDLHPRSMFGELAALDGDPRSAQVNALDAAFVVSLPGEAFLQLMTEYPRLSKYVLRRLARLVRLLSDRIVEMSTLGVINRIHAELLRLAHAAGVDGNRAVIEHMPTREEFASRISTHREAVSREMKLLESSGLIQKLKDHTIIVTDIDLLQQKVDEGSGVATRKAAPAQRRRKSE